MDSRTGRRRGGNRCPPTSGSARSRDPKESCRPNPVSGSPVPNRDQGRLREGSTPQRDPAVTLNVHPGRSRGVGRETGRGPDSGTLPPPPDGRGGTPVGTGPDPLSPLSLPGRGSPGPVHSSPRENDPTTLRGGPVAPTQSPSRPPAPQTTPKAVVVDEGRETWRRDRRRPRLTSGTSSRTLWNGGPLSYGSRMSELSQVSWVPSVCGSFCYRSFKDRSLWGVVRSV